MDMPPGEHLLTIGEFSRLSRISIRMLRHYDDHGVLHPTRVDPYSGYRYYAPDLLRTAQQLCHLRDVGLGVGELADCVPHLDDVAALREVLQRQRARLEADATVVSGRLREVDHLIRTLEEPAMTIDITLKTIPPRTVASVRDTIPTYQHEGMLWNRLMAALPALGAVPVENSACVAVYHDESYVENGPDVEVQEDVVARFPGSTEVACVPVPEQLVAAGTLTGPYEGMDAVFAAIGAWVSERGYRYSGPAFCSYVVGPADNPDPAQWVTEVCVPVVIDKAPSDDATADDDAPSASDVTGGAR